MRGIGTFLGLALLTAACSTGTPSPSAATGYTTAESACQAPSTATKGGSQLAFDWSVAVRLDHNETTVLLFLSGPHELLCEATRGSDGSYADADTGLGTLTNTDPVLSIDTGSGPDLAGTRQIIAGRVPTGTSTLEVGTADGGTYRGVVGKGRYVAWIDGAQLPVRLTARDSYGALLAQLGDTGGLIAPVQAP